jgi:protein TonB
VSDQHPFRRYLPAVALGVVVLVAAVFLVAFMKSFLAKGSPPQKQVVHEVRIIRPPPPEVKPPPPPPPPPPDEKVDVPEPEQEPTPSDQPPPGDQLGVDAAGSGAGDGFGLVGRPGGRDLLATGGSNFTWYASLLKDEILDLLGNHKEVRGGSYSVVVRLWVDSNGKVQRVVLASSSGDRDRDRAIEAALSQMGRLSRTPPADMPQPISLRIVSRV